MLAEREDALDAVRQGFAAAATGSPGLLLVTGAPGSGRSAVLAAAADLVEAGVAPARVLRADATLAESGFPFGVVQQLLRPAVTGADPAEHDRWFAGAAEAVRPLFLDDAAHAAPSTDAVLPGLHALVARLADDHPLLLAVDDLQWTDRPSLRWLAYLARRLGQSRVLLLATSTDGHAVGEPGLVDDVAASAIRTVQLAPLSAAGVHRVLTAEFDEEVDPAFTAACHAVTGGNPAALLAVAHGLHARSVRPSASAAASVAEASHVLLRERRLFHLSTQPSSVRAAARALVVLGDTADTDLVADVAGLDALGCKSAVHAMDRLGLLSSVDPPRLVDPAVGVALEATMPLPQREALHRHAATVLHDAGHPAERVAEQLLRVTRGYLRWEADLLRSAAASALERGAGERAVRYLRRALLAGPPGGPERARLLVDLAAAERGTDPASSVSHVAQALPDLPGVPEAAVAVLSVPFALAARSPSVAAVLRTHAAAPDPHLAGANPDLALRLEARGRALDRFGKQGLTDAVARLRGFGVARPLDTGGGRELLAVLAHAAAATAALPATEVAALGANLLDREQADPAHVHTALPLAITAMVAADAGRVAAPWLERAWDAAQRQESAGVRSAVAAQHAAVLAATGNPGRARVLALGVLDGDASSWPESAATATLVLTSIALHTQDGELARRVLDAGHDAADPRPVLAHLLLRGLLDALRGDVVAALDKLLDCGERAARFGWTNPVALPWRVWAAGLHQRLGDLDRASALAEREYAAALAWGAPTAVGRALRLRGMLLGGVEGVDALRAAVDRLRAGGDPVELGRAQAMLGRRLVGLGDPAGQRAVEEADRIARAAGGVWLAGNDEAELNGPVLRLGASGAAELTRTEQSVVAMVVRGWTNQRIADSLGVTRRAVEKNLTGAYRKLGVRGRSVLVEQWRALVPELEAHVVDGR
ncbi:AAA family ATPase [Saccharothrix longispora]|uniref:DNA-binding CsgD family transcriptional regulator n=1 Tax=Saccharothrix longispora TaxID=33920 RepID=A0ABU1PRB0_9PSEU|nr:AAA family ATPase [Saccharothrix longispora]MDR6593164.1 DNA-binding CsgD family transcriptional regulator [Saccharothrix longispora]